MTKFFWMAWRFMHGESLSTRFVFACYFMFQEKYRVMPLRCLQGNADSDLGMIEGQEPA